MSIGPTNEERLLRLEQSNRRLKISALAIILLSTSICILGAGSPESRVVKASSFILLDEAGNERAELSSAGKTVSLKLLNQNGTQAVAIAAGSDRNSLSIADQSGQMRTALIVDPQSSQFSFVRNSSLNENFLIKDSSAGTELTIRDTTGHKRADIGLNDDVSAAWISDANGTIRAAMSDFGFITFREKGTIAWKDDVYTQDIRRMTDYVQQKLQPRP